MIARAQGMIGTNFGCLSDRNERLETLGIEDMFLS